MREAREILRRLAAVPVPRGAAILACVAISVPGAASLAVNLSFDSQNRVVHHHTNTYGTNNAISGDSALQSGAEVARQQWDSLTEDYDGRASTFAVPSLGSDTGHIRLQRANLGDTGSSIHYTPSLAFHGTHTDITFNSFATNGFSANKKRRKACHAFGRVLGLRTRDSTVDPDCLGTESGIHTPDVGPHSIQTLNDFYGPNVLTSGSLYAERDDLKGSRSYSITGSGHAIERVEIFVDGASKAFAEDPTPCAEQCTLTATIDGTEIGDGEHTVKVVVTNEFGDVNEPPFEFTVHVEAHTGVLRHYRFESERLTDRSDLRVNVASGNLMLEERDLQIAGTGLNLQVGRFWNSLTGRETGFGPGWAMDTAEGVELEELSGGAVRFHGPTGFAVRFKPDGSGGYETPQGINAELSKDTNPVSYELKLSRSEETYFFDAQGRFTKHEDRNDHRIDFTYLPNGHLETITDTQGREVTFSYGTQQEGTEDLIVEMKDDANLGENQDQDRVWRYDYEDGRLTSYEDPIATAESNQPPTTYAYDGQGRLEMITEPNGKRTAIAYDGGSRRVASVTRDADPNGDGPFRTTFTYDATTEDSDDADECTSSQEATVVADPNGNKTTYCTDDESRVKKVFDALHHKQELGYNSHSNINSYVNDGLTYTLNYDNDRLTRAAAPGGTVTEFTYGSDENDFRPTSITDPQGNRQDLGYDSTTGNLSTVTVPGIGQLVKLEYFKGDTGQGEDADWKGLLKSSVNGRGIGGDEDLYKTKYEYDADGNLINEDPPPATGTELQGSTLYGYDNLSRVDHVTDGNAQERQITYDLIDRTADVEWIPRPPPGTQPDNHVAYAYDRVGNLFERTDGNQSQGRGTQKDQYIYDGRNLRTHDTLRNLSGSRANDYTYDDAGNLETLSTHLPSGDAVTGYAYNPVNLVSSITEPDGGTFQFTYDSKNRRETTTFPNGLTQTNDFGNGHLLDILVEKPSGTDVYNMHYRWDADRSGQQQGDGVTDLTGIRYEAEDRVDDITTIYGYDELNRLASATNSGAFTRDYDYEYDKASNLTSEADAGNTTNYSYNVADELTTQGHSYDQNGNLLSAQGGPSFRYDKRSRTCRIWPSGPVTEPDECSSDLNSEAVDFDYADQGQDERLSKDETEFTDTLLGLSVQAPPAADPTHFVRDDAGHPLAMVSMNGPDYYYLSDSLGTIGAIADESGNVVKRYRYEPYGEVAQEVPSSGGPANPLRLAGEYQDLETGLYKMGLRYYDPSLGRWTQKDPLNLFQDPRQGNRYTYAGADPVNLLDPSGAFSVCSGVGFLISCDEAASFVARGVNPCNQLGTLFYDPLGLCGRMTGNPFLLLCAGQGIGRVLFKVTVPGLRAFCLAYTAYKAGTRYGP